jgi:hypothetical protein
MACIKCSYFCSRTVLGTCPGCHSSIGGIERPRWQWDVLHAQFTAHRRSVAAAAAAVAKTGDWIEMKTGNGSYRLVKIDRIHSSGALDVVWFNRATRETRRAADVLAAKCRTRGSSPYLLPAKKLDIARRAGIVNFKDPKNGAGGIDEVGILYEAWNKARREKRAPSSDTPATA